MPSGGGAATADYFGKPGHSHMKTAVNNSWAALDGV